MFKRELWFGKGRQRILIAAVMTLAAHLAVNAPASAFRNLEKGEEAMLSIRNFGEKSLDELKDRLQEKGYLEDGTQEAAKAE